MSWRGDDLDGIKKAVCDSLDTSRQLARSIENIGYIRRRQPSGIWEMGDASIVIGVFVRHEERGDILEFETGSPSNLGVYKARKHIIDWTSFWVGLLEDALTKVAYLNLLF